LDRTLGSGGRWLVQFLEPAWQRRQAHGGGDAAAAHGVDGQTDGLYHAFIQVLACCQRHGVPCLVNSVHPQAWWSHADGVHLRAEDARAWQHRDRPQGLLGVSAHHADELAVARVLQADFAVLGHVLDTPSHPDVPGMGWAAFTRQIEHAGLPVYALGGQRFDTVETAQTYGAHGVAGMRGMLCA